MKLEVGMYVRTRYGTAKITNLSETIDARGFYLDEEIMNCNEENWKSFCTIHDIIGEPSHNIIDLIEVGDYVNGRLVEMIYDNNEKYLGYKIGSCYIRLGTFDIKLIVTKEQFSSMEYKVGE